MVTEAHVEPAGRSGTAAYGDGSGSPRLNGSGGGFLEHRFRLVAAAPPGSRVALPPSATVAGVCGKALDARARAVWCPMAERRSAQG